MVEVIGPGWTAGNGGRYAGRYPLAVERHAMSQVAHLLPGITTVTSHARYYTLHTAVFAEAAVRGLDNHDTRQLLRRSEVVVGAVSIAHDSSPEHAKGMRSAHGSERMASKVASGSVDVEALVADGGYVQAGWGFWGPYIGSEFNLGLLQSQGRTTLPGPAADTSALQTGFDGLFDLVARPTLTAMDLESASHLCVCQAATSADGAMLRDLLVPGSAKEMFSGDRRGQTLRLLLRLTDISGQLGNAAGIDLARLLAYRPEVRDDPTLAGLAVTPAWIGVVLRNEVVAAWRDLWQHLVECIDGFMSIDALGEVLADGLPSGTVADFVSTLPDGIDADGHPIHSVASLDNSISAEAHLLARLVIGSRRHGRLDPKAQAYFQHRRDDLPPGSDEALEPLTPSWLCDRLTDWADRPLRDFAVWLTHQLVARAERIALAKASFDRKTGLFKVPTRVCVRDGYIFRDWSEGGGGVALRWSSAYRVMAGVGLVTWEDGRWQVTPEGHAA